MTDEQLLYIFVVWSLPGIIALCYETMRENNPNEKDDNYVLIGYYLLMATIFGWFHILPTISRWIRKYRNYLKKERKKRGLF